MTLPLWCAVWFLKSLVLAVLSFGFAVLTVSLGGLGVLRFLHVLLRLVGDLPTAPPARGAQGGPQVRSPEPATSERPELLAFLVPPFPGARAAQSDRPGGESEGRTGHPSRGQGRAGLGVQQGLFPEHLTGHLGGGRSQERTPTLISRPRAGPFGDVEVSAGAQSPPAPSGTTSHVSLPARSLFVSGWWAEQG